MDVWSTVGNAKERNGRGNYIGEGRHLFALKDYGLKVVNSGNLIFANLITVESSLHERGSLMSAGWRISLTGWQGEAELARAKSFVCALLKIDGQEAIEKASRALAAKDQVGRGFLIAATGVPIATKSGGKFVDVLWENVAQTGEQVAAMRRLIESGAPIGAAPAPAAVTHAAPAPQTDAAPVSMAEQLAALGVK